VTVRLIHSDNFPALLDLMREGVQFNFAYADVTFCSQRDYFTKDGQFAYSDRWKSTDAWIDSLRGPLSLVWEMLVETGSMVVHVDPRGSHLVRGLLDSICNPGSFASEIVWRYRRWPCKSSNFQRVHDTLLRFVKDPKVKPTWNQLYEPLSPSTLKVWGDKRKQKAKSVDGKRIRSVLTEELSKGCAMGDVWDISIIAPQTAERTGYPTQKPEELLERLILSCTNPGDWILDPYLGSGTSLAVAHRLGRNGVGVDKSVTAIEISTKRIQEIDFSSALSKCAEAPCYSPHR
jgi:DNA modification methylase